jgi:transcriptional regulator GlxA family with amidase domain
MPHYLRFLLLLAGLAAVAFAAPSARAALRPVAPSVLSPVIGDGVAARDRIPAYQARLGRRRPVIAVLAENSGTELVDFVIPYGVLARSGVAEVFAVAMQAGPITMRPALRIQPQATIAQFDARFPDGADYLIVPAMVSRDDPRLLAWIAAQAGKGGTVVSICDGALVVADAGLLKRRRATAHWATEGLRAEKYPDTHWLRNIRYVADGRMISSAGISAALPVSLALVEAIAGPRVAGSVAQQLGVDGWSAAHDSERFRPKFGVNLRAFAATNYTNRWLHSRQRIGLPLSAGIDEIALALTADPYSRTGCSQVYGLSASSEPVRTSNGLLVLPERIIGAGPRLDRVLPALDATPPAQMLDQTLAGIARRYGRLTAFGVALDFEYPGLQGGRRR